MMRKTKTALAATSALATLAVVAGVHAETYSLPALACVEAGDSAPEITYSGGNGQSYNDNGTYHADYVCSILRRAPDTSSISSINVVVDDSSSDSAVDCHAVSCPTSGTCTIGAGDASSGTGQQTLSLGSVTGSTSGYAFIKCNVPDSDSSNYSGVVSYRWAD